VAVLSGSGISWAIFKSALRSRQITTPAPHHSKFFTGRMPFLPPNQLHQSTEGLAKSPSKSQKCSRLNSPAPSTHPNSLMSVIASEQACCRSFFAVRRRINAVHRLRMELHRRLRYDVDWCGTEAKSPETFVSEHGTGRRSSLHVALVRALTSWAVRVSTDFPRRFVDPFRLHTKP